MTDLPQEFPQPDNYALEHSETLLKAIRAEIVEQGGSISFAEYMRLALYAPGLGYYSAGSKKLGPQGDFITAPEISPLFASCLARQCHQVLKTLAENGQILELGAGTGKMAIDLLLALEQLDCLPRHYLILEISAELRERQMVLLKAKIPHLWNRVKWLDTLPNTPFSGVILANEVLDALPVERFHFDNTEIQSWHVGWQNQQLAWQLAPATTALKEAVAELPFTDNTVAYDSEINLMLPAWINSLSACLAQGLVLLIDYGFPRNEYYHPQRSMGTLMCHYRHRAHDNPLILPGLQDITAHIDYTAVAESAVAANLQVAGYANQAAFLLSCGLLDLVPSNVNDVRQRALQNQQIQKLTSPTEMGELFKVIALARDLDDLDLLGFSLQDQRGRL